MPDFIDVELTDIAFNGPAIGRINGPVVFADFGIPGETVRVEIESRKKDYLNGRVVEVVDKSPHRVEPPCPYFGRCGGCQWQHIDYPHQLELKTKVVRDQFRRIAKMPEAPVRDMLPSPSEWNYRNHARFVVNDRGELGFNFRRSHQFIGVDECRISDPRINAALTQLQGKCQGLEHVDVRTGVEGTPPLIAPRVRSVAPGLETGQKTLEEMIGPRSFRVSVASFFQGNTAVAETLVDLVRQALALEGGETVIDAYAGVGTFACFLAETAGNVIAIEESNSAIWDANFNLNSQNIENVEIERGAVEDLLPIIEGGIDALVLDPPRTGCDRRVLNSILDRQPSRIAYVSCDPATLARDVKILVDGGYRLDWVQPLDQFPQTYHIEAVVRLSWPE
jgi:23S rRNA (uracil1939-C5)-methyltransferase